MGAHKYRKFPLVVEKKIQGKYDVHEIKVLCDDLKDAPEGVSIKMDPNSEEKTNFAKKTIADDIGDGRAAVTAFYCDFDSPMFPKKFEALQYFLFTYGTRMRISS